jgi:hypothetical protein
VLDRELHGLLQGQWLGGKSRHPQAKRQAKTQPSRSHKKVVYSGSVWKHHGRRNGIRKL